MKFFDILLRLLIAIHKARIYLISRFPDACQRRTLRKILKEARRTDFGKKYHFAEIADADAYARRVPTQRYEDMRHFAQRIIDGECNVLTNRTLSSVTTTSGTTGKPKIIPQYKAMLRTEYLQAIVGMLDCVRHAEPGALDTPLTIVVAGRESMRTNSRIEHAASANETYRKNIFSRYLAIPQSVFDIDDSSVKYYYCALFMMRARSRMILTPNPTTVLRMLSVCREFADTLHLDLESSTLANRFAIPAEQFREIEGAWQRSARRTRQVDSATPKFLTSWRFLKVIVCWKGGSAGFYIDQLVRQFDHTVKITDLGYLASDSPLMVSDSGAEGQLVMARNVYAEFRPAGDESARLYQYHELRHGMEYLAFITNAYGMYRYDTQDIFRVVGRKNRAPTLQFVRKASGFANITGEKLSEDQVLESIQVVEKRIKTPCHFFISIPWLAESRYYFYLELVEPGVKVISDIEQAIDDELCLINLEYAGKRASGRLHVPAVRILKANAHEKVKTYLVERGAREAQFKLGLLQADDRLKSLLDQLIDPVAGNPCGRRLAPN